MATIHLRLRHLISLQDKEADAGHECRGYRHVQPAPTHPSSLHTHAHRKLSLPCTALTCIHLCHQAIRSKPQILQRPVSFVVVRRGQSLPEGASMLRGRGADGCRRGPLSRQTHASPLLRVLKLGQYCAIEVVPSRLILEIHLDQPHVISVSVEITKPPKTIVVSACVQTTCSLKIY